MSANQTTVRTYSVGSKICARHRTSATHLLWAQGNVHAAIQEEELCNELTKIYNVDILCGYSVEGSQGGMDSVIFQQICAEHAGGRESRY